MVADADSVVCTVSFVGGGPADGRVIDVTASHLNGIRERRFLEGYFWGVVYGIKFESVDVYCSKVPHDSEQIYPPRTLELWYNPHTDPSDWTT